MGDDAPLTSLGNGRYELLDVLGQGGMGAVWRAEDRTTGDLVAIKVLHPNVAERRSQRSRFLAEADTLRRLHHPNLLRVRDAGEDHGRPWFTMDIVDGGALIDRLEQTGKLPPLEALDVVFQVLQALHVAHLARVVHRDVKPDNVLISADGTVRLSDFGIARIRDVPVNHRTDAGVAMGTAGYMAPEQRESARDVGPPADVYGVGATLYAAAAGLEPRDLFAAHLDPRMLDPVPPALREVVRKSTAYRPEKRYPDARAMAVDVARAYDDLARTRGLPEPGAAWMARFDRLVAEAFPGGAPAPAIAEAPPPSAPRPTLPTLPTAPPPPSAPAPAPGRAPGVGVAAAVAFAVAVALLAYLGLAR